MQQSQSSCNKTNVTVSEPLQHLKVSLVAVTELLGDISMLQCEVSMLQCDLTRLLQDLLSHNPKSCSGRCETVSQYRHQRLISGDFTSVYNFVNTHAYVCAQLQIPGLPTPDLGIRFK